MKTFWQVAFLLNLSGAGLCLFAGFTLLSYPLIILGSINVGYALLSAIKLGDLE